LEGGLIDDLPTVLLLELHPHPQHIAAILAADGPDGIGTGHLAQVLRILHGRLDFCFEIVVHSNV
jgi:hypothetical protein